MRYLLLFLCCGFLCKPILLAQQSPPSPQQIQQLAEHSGTDRIPFLLALAKIYGSNNPAKALQHASEAALLATQSKQNKEAAEAYLLQSEASGWLGDQNASLLAANQAEALYIDQKSTIGRVKVLISKVRAHHNQGNFIESDSIANLGLTLTHGEEYAALKKEILVLKSRAAIFKGFATESEALAIEAQKINPAENTPALAASIHRSLGRVYWFTGQTERGHQHLRQALEQATAVNHLQLIGYCHLALASFEKRAMHYQQSFEHIQKASAIAEQTQNRRMAMLAAWKMVRIKTKLNHGPLDQNDFEKVKQECLEIGDNFNYIFISITIHSLFFASKSLSHDLKLAIELMEESQARQYRWLQGIIYYSLAKTYHNLSQFDKAKEFGTLGFEMAQELDYSDGFLSGCRDLSILFSSERKFDKAIALLQAGIEKAQQTKAKRYALLLQRDLARLHYFNGYRDQALELLDQLFKKQALLDADPALAINVYQAAGQIERMHRPQASMAYFEKSIELCELIGKRRPKLIAHYFLYLIHEASGNYKDALKHESTRNELRRAIEKEDREKEISTLQVEFETNQKEQEILAIKKEKELQALSLENKEAKIIQQRLHFISLLFGALLLLGLGLFLFNRYQLRQKNETLRLHSQQLELERKQEKTLQQLELSELRSDFFTNVSHEFRTPLTLILGPLEKLIPASRPEDKVDLKRIERNANRLLSLVNETLDLAKLEKGHLALFPQRQVLAELAKEMVLSFSPLSEVKGVALNLKDESQGCFVDFDWDKLEKVLSNLLSNAFNHSANGDSIQLTLKAPEQNSIAILVQDTGIGIATEHLPYLFDRFFQVDKKGPKGSGVGLALSKQLVELHQGSIEVQSSPGSGSTFSITLPLRHPDAAMPEENSSEEEVPGIVSNEPKPPVNASAKTVLVIEDHHEVRQYLQELLQRNYQVLTAKDGIEGIAVAEQFSPDLIVSDVMMPHKDGLELTAYLKQNLATSHIPIVLLTAKASTENKLQGLQNGADDYLAKPFHSQELLQRCHNLLAQRERLRQLFSNNDFIAPKKLSHNTTDHAFLEKAVRIIEENMENSDFSVTDFCSELAYNRTGVHMKLKALTGNNTTQFIKSIKLKKAAELIKNSDHNITNIATMVGFKTRQTFNKAFKEQFHLTPSEFKKHDGPIPIHLTKSTEEQ